MRFVTLGNSADIGASCHFLDTGSATLVLDAGADPNFEGPACLPDFRVLKERRVDHALISHAHHDHIGSIPSLVAEWPDVQLHMTPATATLSSMMLYASARLQRRKYYEGSSPYPPLFEEEDLDAVHEAVRQHRYRSPFRVGDGLAEFRYAGHLLGAAGTLFTSSGGRRIYYTSDTSTQDQTIIPGAQYPKGPIDVLIMESTLGADPKAELAPRPSEEQRFLRRLQAVLDRGGTVLLPVFMLGRAQEILALLGRFRDQGQIDPDVPIYTAGGLLNVSRIYDESRLDTPRLNPEFEVYGVTQQRFPKSRKATLRILNQPGILVLASGMMIANTLSNRVAQLLIERERDAIFLVGFAKPDLPAGQLLCAARDGAETITLDPRVGPQAIRCEIDRFRFSGHANRLDLTALVGRMRASKVVLVHGDTAARNWLADQIRRQYPKAEVVTPVSGEWLQL